MTQEISIVIPAKAGTQYTCHSREGGNLVYYGFPAFRLMFNRFPLSRLCQKSELKNILLLLLHIAL